MVIKPYLLTHIATVWAIAIVFTALLSSIWYIFQPAFTYTIILMDDGLETTGANCTESDNVVTLLRLAVNITIPMMIVGLWIWAFVSSHKKDWRGYYE